MNSLGLDKEILAKFCRKNGISYLGVFGSRARGEANKDSDVDLLARFNSQKSLLDLVRLENQLSKAIGKKVDLLTEPSLSPYLKDKVVSEVQTIYESQG